MSKKDGILITNRKVGDSVYIDKDVQIHIKDVQGKRVVLAITAPGKDVAYINPNAVANCGKRIH